MGNAGGRGGPPAAPPGEAPPPLQALASHSRLPGDTVDGVGLTGLAAGAVPALVLGPQGGAAAGGKHRALPR